jgi:hypothetical protein
MSGPRNRVAWERGQAIRAAIREYLDEHAQLHRYARRPTWREIQAHLRMRRYYIERSAICYHIQQIELGAELEIGRQAADVSMPGEAAR